MPQYKCDTCRRNFPKPVWHCPKCENHELAETAECSRCSYVKMAGDEPSEQTELIHYDAARKELAIAANIDEVKIIRDRAESIRQYVRQQKGTLEMQNQVAEIKVRAERKLGEMLKEQIPHDGGRPIEKPLHDERVIIPPTLKDLGISEIQSHRWQSGASLPEYEFEEFIAESKELNIPITSQAIIEKAKNVHVSNNSGQFEWYTPIEYIESARVVMGSIDIDPASSEIANLNVQAVKYFSKEDDGRQQKWPGNVWMNPPYSQPLISEFCGLLVDKYNANEIIQACVLVNNATETAFYQKMLTACSAICFIKGRVKFLDADGNANGAPLQGQTILYFGPHTDKFNDGFSKYGKILYAARQRENSFT